jgi:hypothetical protein
MDLAANLFRPRAGGMSVQGELRIGFRGLGSLRGFVRFRGLAGNGGRGRIVVGDGDFSLTRWSQCSGRCAHCGSAIFPR